MKTKNLFTAAAIVTCFISALNAQNLQWVKATGSTGTDNGNSVCKDASGNDLRNNVWHHLITARDNNTLPAILFRDHQPRQLKKYFSGQTATDRHTLYLQPDNNEGQIQNPQLHELFLYPSRKIQNSNTEFRFLHFPANFSSGFLSCPCNHLSVLASLRAVNHCTQPHKTKTPAKKNLPTNTH